MSILTPEIIATGEARRMCDAEAERNAGDVDVEALLVFRVGTTWLAVPATAVGEVADVITPTRIPRVPAHIPGVINLRGRAVPLLDLGHFLSLSAGDAEAGAPSKGDGASDRIVVVQHAGMHVGLMCHQIFGVQEIPRSQLRTPRATQGSTLHEFAVAEIDRDQTPHTVIDLAKLLEQARVDG